MSSAVGMRTEVPWNRVWGWGVLLSSGEKIFYVKIALFGAF